MSPRPKSLLREETPENVIGEIAKYLVTVCGVPGCTTIFHINDAETIVKIIVDYNKRIKERE